MDKQLNILVIEDNEDDFRLLTRALSKEIDLLEAKRVDTVESLKEALNTKAWDVVISDNNVPDHRVSPRFSFELSRNIDPNVPFIIVSGTIEEENAVQLMKLGVNDYILKDSLARLAPAVKREVAEAQSRLKKVEAEINLTRSEERYRLLTESITDMFFATDRNLNCTFWNSTAEKITRVKAADAIGKHLFDILPVANTEPLREKILHSIHTLEHGSIEVEHTVENTRHCYEATIYPSHDVHSVIVKDITSARQIARELKSVNEELETFIYRVSHDIRGPLASIQGLVNLAQAETFSAKAEDLFSRIGQMTGRLDYIIRNLQDVVRIKQEEIELVPTSLGHVWQQTLQALGETARHVEFEMPEGETGMLVTDQKLLTLALQRIVANAIMFAHPARYPEVVVRYAKVNSKYHQLTVTDNGIGIAPDQMENIFKMFFRGSILSTGSGLGLYLAQSAMSKLGGTIHAASVNGEGSVFTMRWMNNDAQGNELFPHNSPLHEIVHSGVKK